MKDWIDGRANNGYGEHKTIDQRSKEGDEREKERKREREKQFFFI